MQVTKYAVEMYAVETHVQAKDQFPLSTQVNSRYSSNVTHTVDNSKFRSQYSSINQHLTTNNKMTKSLNTMMKLKANTQTSSEKAKLLRVLKMTMKQYG